MLTDLCSELISKISIEVLCIDVRSSAVESGVADLTVDAGVSIDMISIIQALIIIFVAAPLLVKRIMPFLFADKPKEDADHG